MTSIFPKLLIDYTCGDYKNLQSVSKDYSKIKEKNQDKREDYNLDQKVERENLRGDVFRRGLGREHDNLYLD